MSVHTATHVNTADAPVKSLVTAGVVASVAAAAATSAVAAVGKAAGVSLTVGGDVIPVSGFAVLTLVFSGIGVVLAWILTHRARRARAVFVRTTTVLTVASLVPDVMADASAATIVLLMLTHVVAAAIVIPVVARRLP